MTVKRFLKLNKSLLLCTALASGSISAAETQLLIDGNDKDGTRHVTPLADGGYVLTGWTNGNATKKDAEGWLVKVNAKGDIVWQQRFANQLKTKRGAQTSTHVVDKDGSIIMALEEYRNKGPYLATGSNGRATLKRFSAGGKLLQEKVMGGSGINVIDIIIPMADGSYLMAGETTSPIQKGYDGWIFKTDNNFNVLWDTKVGGFGVERFNSVMLTPDGGFLAAGRTTSDHGDFRAWLVKLDSNGKVQWQKRYRDEHYANTIRQILPTSNGNWVFTGFIKNQPNDPDPRNLWIGAVDEQGNLLWDKALGGAGADVAYVLTQAKDGTYVAAGSTQQKKGDTYDAYIVGFNANGKVLYERKHGQPEANEIVRGITPYGQSGYVLSGNYEVPATGQQDAWLLKVK